MYYNQAYSADNSAYCRRMEQSVARRAHNPKVVGSNPTPATISFDSVFYFKNTVKTTTLQKSLYFGGVA